MERVIVSREEVHAALRRPVTRREGATAVLALAAIGVVTAAWWALALWPLPEAAPGWVERTRLACFGAAADGLPHAGGWILLVGEPLGMIGALALVWGRELRAGLARVAGHAAGRAALSLTALAVLLGVGAAGARVRGASGAGGVPLSGAEVAGVEPVYLGRRAPPLELVDQHGEPLSLDRFRGRPVLLAFAYAHCRTVCPLIVHDALAAQRQVPGADAALVVVTLDPWRDTPSRLPHVAAAWGMGEGAFLAGGEVERVERVLDAWNVARTRDGRTGEISHPTSVYVIDDAGRIAYVVPGERQVLARALARAAGL